MGLNSYKDEAKEFLIRIGAKNEGIDKKIELFEEEFDELKTHISNRVIATHKIYDLLFILFEIASEYDSDLDLEWEKGRERKSRKY